MLLGRKDKVAILVAIGFRELDRRRHGDVEVLVVVVVLVLANDLLVGSVGNVLGVRHGFVVKDFSDFFLFSKVFSFTCL